MTLENAFESFFYSTSIYFIKI